MFFHPLPEWMGKKDIIIIVNKATYSIYKAKLSHR